MAKTETAGEVRWDGSFDDWTLTNGNLTRYPGAVCIDNPAEGPAVCDSPVCQAAGIIAEGWRKMWVSGVTPVGTVLKVYFRVAATEEAVAGADWIGPYDSLDPETGELWVNMSNELEKLGLDDVVGWFQLRVKIMPA